MDKEIKPKKDEKKTTKTEVKGSPVSISFKINSPYLQSLTVIKDSEIPMSVYVADAKNSINK